MITAWKITGFKSIQSTQTLNPLPLTLLAGANSSGKSSLIQSILLVVQSLASKVVDRPIILNGPLIRLGNFSDILSTHGDGQIELSWTITPQHRLTTQFPTATGLGAIYCDLNLTPNKTASSTELADLNPVLQSFNLHATNLEGKDIGGISINKTMSTVEEARDSKLSATPGADVPDYIYSPMAALNYDVTLTGAAESAVSLDPGSMTIVGCWLPHFVALGVIIRTHRPRAIAKGLTNFDKTFGNQISTGLAFQQILHDPSTKAAIGFLIDNLPEQFQKHFSSSRSTPPLSIFDWRRRVDIVVEGDGRALIDELATLTEAVQSFIEKSGSPEYSYAFVQLGADVESAARAVLEQFPSTIHYLGPLRDEPRPLQPLGVAAELDFIGFRGEQTAAVYERFKNQNVRYYSPSALDAGEIESKTARLEAALLEWLQYMGLAEGVRTEDLGKLGHSISIVMAGSSRELTHVGVGLSQLLPVLVKCLIANQGSTLLFEQPELHLHPKVQAQLGDFFVSIALSGVQCIVETHSEHLINRLRYRAASFSGTEIADLLKIYFVENNIGQSHFREVNVNEYGAIADWPNGFFDQSQIEAEKIIRAALSKRSKRAR